MSPSYHLSRNLAIIRRRWPRLAHRIETSAVALQVERPTDTPEPTLRVEGVLLASGYDRRREATLQARMIPHEAGEAWIYGAALGDLPKLLLQREPLQALHVVILNWSVFRAALTQTDQTKWLADPRMHLNDGRDHTVPRTPFTVAPACLHLAAPEAAPLRDRLQLQLDTPFIRSRHKAAVDWPTRCRENAARVAHDYDVSALFGSFPEATFLVAGSGPTLATSLPTLREHRDGTRPLVAAYDTLAALHAAHVVPDLVVSIAPTETLQPMHDAYAQTPLVYFPSVPPEVLARWPGPRFAAYPDRPGHPFEVLQARFDRGRLYSNGSTFHVLLDLAVRMGAVQTVLFGADFAFPGGYTHARGVPGRRTASVESPVASLPDGYGAPVATSPHHRGALRDLEAYLQAHPDLQVINSSREGAFISGTMYLDELNG